MSQFTLVSATATQQIARVDAVRDGAELKAPTDPEPLSELEVVSALPNEIRLLAADGRAMILGVSPSSLYSEFVSTIAVAREFQNPVPLIMAGVFAVAEGYTVASTWAEKYASLPKPHPFMRFEIADRKPTKDKDGKALAGWVTNSKMNSSAVHIMGHMIVEAAPENSFLGTVKKQAGTIFAPLNDDDGKERTKIMKEAFAALTENDKAAVGSFKENFQKYVKVIAVLFGTSQAGYSEILEKVKKLGDLQI